MEKYRRKPGIIEAFQWNGLFYQPDADGVVKPYPDITSHKKCEHCGEELHKHGWLKTLEGGHIACANDWIITGIKGEKYPCKPDIFDKLYDLVDEN